MKSPEILGLWTDESGLRKVVTDKQRGTSNVKMPWKVQLALAVALFAGLVTLLIFTVSPRIADAYTAAGTVALALATLWLGIQTRNAVQVNEREMDQNRELLALTRQQAETAEISTRIVVESNRPFVSIRQEQQLRVNELNGKYGARIPIHNYGASVALIEMGKHRPSAKLAKDGTRFSLGVPDTVVLPRDTSAYISFEFDRVSQVGEPVMRPDRTYIAFSMDYWFSDVSKTTHYGVHAEFDLADESDSRFLGLLRLTNIEFGPPLDIEVDGRDARSIPHFLLDRGSLN
jgi:hypothetical protein